jgi:thiol:disulfide interchange protein
MNYRPSSWLDQLVGGCCSVLIGAAAIFLAVRLIQAVWVIALSILGVIGLVAVAVLVVRSRRQQW